MPYLRYLANTPYVEMCITTIIDEICSIPWEIIIDEDFREDYIVNGEVIEAKKKEIEHCKIFFNNPNTNKDSFETVFIKRPVRDLLSIESGILNKVFNLKGEMVEVVARDGATFTKNPDIHGMFTNRVELMIPTHIVNNASEVMNPFVDIAAPIVNEQAAYFQYGWVSGPIPVPFGKREIIWLERAPRTDDHYGMSPVQILSKSLQTLMYMIDSDLEYYNANNIPKGIIGFENADANEIEGFKQQWKEQMRYKDEFGNWKKATHEVPIINKIPEFKRIEFSAQEMELIEKQKWYTRMVWGCFGVTATELGYTEDAKGMSNQIVQSKVFKKKAIYPILRLLETAFTKEIIELEFEYEHLKFKFNTFDIDDEKNKVGLYDLELKAGLKTVNEIRSKEGLDPVDWGDEAPNKWQTPNSSFSFGNTGERNFNDREEQANNTEEPKKPKKEEKSLSDDYHETDEDDEEGMEEKLKKKDYEILGKAIKESLKQNEDKILELIEKETSNNKLAEIKDLNDIIKALKSILSFAGLKAVSDEIIRTNFFSGWDKAEKKLEQNFIPNNAALDFLQKYTFDNIKGLTDDIVPKLRQVLQRGIIEGRGANYIKEEIKKVFDIGDNRAEMISRTEIVRAQNQGELLAFKESGIEMYKIWHTHFDPRTSPICKRLDGQRVKINENFKDPKGEWEGQAPPSHVNCRSSVDYELE